MTDLFHEKNLIEHTRGLKEDTKWTVWLGNPYIAVSRKVVQNKHKSVRDNAER